jgi:PPOX class probable F420-dependent enzyme
LSWVIDVADPTRTTMTDTPTVPDPYRDLLDAPVGILATNGADGTPQVTAIWFLHDEADDLIKFSLNDGRQKVRNLKRDPHATFLIPDPANPYRTVELRGTVDITPDTGFAFAAVLGAKYGENVHSRDLSGETRSVIILHPTKVNIWPPA